MLLLLQLTQLWWHQEKPYMLLRPWRRAEWRVSGEKDFDVQQALPQLLLLLTHCQLVPPPQETPEPSHSRHSTHHSRPHVKVCH